MKNVKKTFAGVVLLMSMSLLGCNSTDPAPAGSPPSSLTYSHQIAVYVVDSIIPNNVPVAGGTVVRYSESPDLPGGLSVNDSSGIISGRPYSASPAVQYVVSAFNNGGSISDTITIVVNQTSPYYLSYSTPVAYATGTAVNMTPTVLGALNQ